MLDQCQVLLITTYCSNLYCAPIWFDCTKTALKKLKVAYNNSLRRFMGLPWHNSVSEMFFNLNINSFIIFCMYKSMPLVNCYYNVDREQDEIIFAPPPKLLEKNRQYIYYICMYIFKEYVLGLSYF